MHVDRLEDLLKKLMNLDNAELNADIATLTTAITAASSLETLLFLLNDHIMQISDVQSSFAADSAPFSSSLERLLVVRLY